MLFLENEAQINRNNYGTMLFMSKQVSLPKISSILQKMKIGQNSIYALFGRRPSIIRWRQSEHWWIFTNVCFIVVVFIHSWHHHLKMSSFSWKKKKFWSINLTCWWLSQPLGLWFLRALNTSSFKDFWPKGKSSHCKNSPSFQISWTWSDVFQINESFIQQLSAMFTCWDGKDGELGKQALVGWIKCHINELCDLSSQNVQFLYSTLEIILNQDIQTLRSKLKIWHKVFG